MSQNMGSIYAEMRLKLDELRKDVDQVEKELGRAEQGVTKTGNAWMTTGASMMKIGGILTAAVTVPLVTMAIQATRTAADFEQGMAEVAAISRATEDDMASLTQQAMELGSTTRYTAVEAAEGMTMLARAGWEAHEIMAAMPGMLNLAAAGALDLGKAADIVSDVMMAFGENADQATRYADVFARAASIANTTVEGLGDAMSYGASAAKAASMELETAAALMIAFADAGIKGGRAGTTFEAVLRELKNKVKDGVLDFGDFTVAVYDTEGAMRHMIDIIGDIEAGLTGMTDQQRDTAMGMVFTQRALRGMNLWLTRGSDSLRDLETELYNAHGAAAEMSHIMMSTLKGAFIELSSAVEGVKIGFGNIFIPLVTKAVKVAVELVRWIAGLSDETKKVIVYIAGFVAAIGPLLVIFGGLALGIGLLVAHWATLSALMVTGAILFAKILIPIVALTAAVVLLANHFAQELVPAIELFGEGVSKETAQAVGLFLEMSNSIEATLTRLMWSGQELTAEMALGIVNNFDAMAKQIIARLAVHETEITDALISLFTNGVKFAEEEQASILEAVAIGYAEREAFVQEAQERVNAIYQTSLEEQRDITREEMMEINALRQEMENLGIEILSESAREAYIIRENMREQAEAINARMAADIVKSAIEVRDAAIEAAEDQYYGVLSAIIMLREAGTISEEIADKLIDEAQRQRDEAVALTEDMHDAIISEAQAFAGQYVDEIDWATGEVLTKWDQFVANFKKNTETLADASIGDKIAYALYGPISTGFAVFGDLEKFFDALRTWPAKVGQILAPVGEWFSNVFTVIIPGAINSALEWFKSIPEKIGAAFQGLLGAVTAKATELGESAKQGLIGIGESIVDFFVTTLPDLLITGFEILTTFFLDDLPYMIGFGMGTLVRLAIEGVTTVVEWFFSLPEKIGNALETLWDIVTTIWTTVITFIVESAKKAYVGIREWFFVKLPEMLKTAFDTAVQTVINTWNWITTELPGIAKEAVDGAIEWFKDLVTRIGTWLGNAITKVVTWASDLRRESSTAGRRLVIGFIEEVLKLPGRLWDWLIRTRDRLLQAGSLFFNAAKRVAENLWRGFQDGLGMKSPSYLERAIDDIIDKGKELPRELQRSFAQLKDLERAMPELEAKMGITAEIKGLKQLEKSLEARFVDQETEPYSRVDDRKNEKLAHELGLVISNSILSALSKLTESEKGDVVLNVDGRTLARILKPHFEMENVRTCDKR